MLTLRFRWRFSFPFQPLSVVLTLFMPESCEQCFVGLFQEVLEQFFCAFSAIPAHRRQLRILGREMLWPWRELTSRRGCKHLSSEDWSIQLSYQRSLDPCLCGRKALPVYSQNDTRLMAIKLPGTMAKSPKVPCPGTLFLCVTTTLAVIFTIFRVLSEMSAMVVRASHGK